MHSGAKPEANERYRNGGRLELYPLVCSPDGELEVSRSRPRGISCSQYKGDAGVVFKTFPDGTLAEGSRISKKSAGQGKCSGELIFVLMTPTLGPYEVLFGSAWISFWLWNRSGRVFRYCHLPWCLMQ